MPLGKVAPSENGTVEKPINREPYMIELVSSFITNNDSTTYDRNHGPIQHRSGDHRVTIDGDIFVSQSLSLSLEQLVNDFPQARVTCALQCAGNRRHTMRTRIKEVLGVDWLDGAVMNCTWEGPRVRDILLAVGVEEHAMHNSVAPKHVHFASYGSRTQSDEWYGGSIPLERAMDPAMDVILAVKMNGSTLPVRHGFPVRAIVPGVLGARSVKWLDRITVSDRESPCFYQQRDYKILPPDAVCRATAEKYWSRCSSMLDMPVNSCVAYPASGSTISLPSSGLVQVHGYAVPQGAHGPVARVQVSGDEGQTWVDAQLEDGGEDASRWSWTLWNATIKMERGPTRRIFAKATDAAGNTQICERSAWNLRGVAYNGYEAVFDLTIL